MPLNHTYSFYYCFRYIVNKLSWCGSENDPGIDFKECPWECSIQSPYWSLANQKVGCEEYMFSKIQMTKLIQRCWRNMWRRAFSNVLPTDSTVVRVFAFRTRDRGSIPCRFIPKTIKMVIVPPCQGLDKRKETKSQGFV